jgi:hypothetical protein
LAESRFADQVHHLKALKKPWRFGIELHNTVYGLAEALLNIWWRRLRREEALIFSSDQVSRSALLCYYPTVVFDDYVLKDKFNDDPMSERSYLRISMGKRTYRARCVESFSMLKITLLP